MKRNKLKPQRVEDLVFIQNNLQLLSRRSLNHNEGECKMWVVRGADFDSIDIESAGLLKIADLSLDESELEAILFDLGNATIYLVLILLKLVFEYL